MSDKEPEPGGAVGLGHRPLFPRRSAHQKLTAFKGVVMNLNKLARWASVAAFSVIVPAAAMAKARHTHPTTAPSSLTSRHVKPASGKKAVASKLSTRSIKSKQLKTTKSKSVALKSKKTLASKLTTKKHATSKLTTQKHIGKLTAKKHVVSKLATKKHVSSRLTTAKAKTKALSSHKATVKPAVKTQTSPEPTM
jgi:hypothetical protein